MAHSRILALALALAALGVAAPAAYADEIDLSVLSSRADQVSGGDALVRVDAPRDLWDKLQVFRNGDDVTEAFEPQDGGLVGLVDGLELGENELTVKHNRHSAAAPKARLTLTNYPTEGPMFSGPHQAPFVCKTIPTGLGEPLVDNQAGDGFRVLNADGTTAGWSRNCSAPTQVDYLYRRTNGNFAALPASGRPADMSQATLMDGSTVDYIVRRERGTINRFIYSFAMLVRAATSRAQRRTHRCGTGG
jgi:hypothetical protein